RWQGGTGGRRRAGERAQRVGRGADRAARGGTHRHGGRGADRRGSGGRRVRGPRRPSGARGGRLGDGAGNRPGSRSGRLRDGRRRRGRGPDRTAQGRAMTDTPGTTSSAKGRAVSPWNIANILTVVRLVLVPFFVVCLFLPGTGWRVTALVVFVLASLTDRLDGELARRYGLVTDFGKIADPIADKALIGARS